MVVPFKCGERGAHTVTHVEDALDLSAEVSVTGRVDDVDLVILYIQFTQSIYSESRNTNGIQHGVSSSAYLTCDAAKHCASKRNRDDYVPRS